MALWMLYKRSKVVDAIGHAVLNSSGLCYYSSYVIALWLCSNSVRVPYITINFYEKTVELIIIFFLSGVIRYTQPICVSNLKYILVYISGIKIRVCMYACYLLTYSTKHEKWYSKDMNPNHTEWQWLPLCMAPVIFTLLAGSCPRTKGYRVHCHLSIFICLCYFSVAVVVGVVVCIYV